MIQLEQQQHGEFVVVVGGVRWLTPTTYIQLAGAGSIFTVDSVPNATEAYIRRGAYIYIYIYKERSIKQEGSSPVCEAA